jgi:Brp/Blh family beta-carotene 15,15'-monooxygenase
MTRNIATVLHMEQVKLEVFSKVRLYSSAAIGATTVLSILFSSSLGADSLNWQVAIAVIALAIGIPHGALDHLITLPRSKPLKMALFIAIYVAIALAAIWAILRWNVWGFIGVVVMSATHFGIGDSAFIAELNGLQGKKSPRKVLFAYAAVSGTIPVVIPLVNDRSTQALEKVNAELINWHGGYTSEILILVAAVTTISILILISAKRFRDLADLALLIALVTFAPPLVAFAAYFGCWHAMRHTARLTSLLPTSQAKYQSGKPFAAFMSAVIPGLPALAGTFIFIIVLAGFARESITDRFLWLTLVTIWALTVPHMMVTARLDRAALKN